MARQILEHRRVGGVDPQLAQLDLRRRPGQVQRPLRGAGIVITIGQLKGALTCGCHQSGEGHRA
jgi:hypothetical protein